MRLADRNSLLLLLDAAYTFFYLPIATVKRDIEDCVMAAV